MAFSILGDVRLRVETLDETGGGTLLERARAAVTSRRDADRGPSDLAAILYTSGTTGRSKGAMLIHHNLLSNAATLKRYWHFSRQDRLLHALPVFHAHGLFVATNTTLLSGSSMLMMSKFARQILELIPGSKLFECGRCRATSLPVGTFCRSYMRVRLALGS